MTSTELRLATCLCALSLTLFATTGDAQPRDDDARRRQLILQAGALRDRGDHVGALERLNQAAARRMSPSLRLFIAQEERSLGRYLDAIGNARLCAEEFDADASLAHRDEFLASCRGLVEELSMRVGRLTVRVPAEVRGVTVTVAGDALPRDEWNTARERLPGRVVVTASAPGRTDFTREVTVLAGGSATVRVELPSAEGPRLAFPNPPRHGEERPAERGVGAGPWVLLGVAGASFIASGVLYALRGQSLDARDALCRSATGDCVVRTPADALEAASQQDSASTFNTIANVSLGVGVAAAVGGVVWWVVGTTSAPSRRASVLVAPTGDGAVFGLRSSF